MENSLDKQQIKRARLTALVLATSLVVALVSLTYAFTRSQEVERITKEAEQVKVLAEKHRLEAEQVAAEVNMRLADALRALDECKANTK